MAHRPKRRPDKGKGIGRCAYCGDPVPDHDFIVNVHKELLHDRYANDCATLRHKERLTNDHPR